MIQLRNIERSYKTGAGQTWVLRRINLDIRPGDFLTIMGPSGAGKSSLLNILALLDDQWLGEYWLKDEPVHAMNRKQRAEARKYLNLEPVRRTADRGAQTSVAIAWPSPSATRNRPGRFGGPPRNR